MTPMVKDLGAFPASGPEGREKKIFYHLSDDNSIKMISGKRTPALLSVWASNDVVQFGTIKVLSGGPGPQQTEWDQHPGDIVFYILKGTMSFFVKEQGDTFDVEEGDFMYIPAGMTYKIINYYGKTTEAIFSVAPEF